MPVGSLAKGEALVTSGGSGKTIACASCHGPDHKGLGPLPSIAGRSPSYMFRQLYDFKHGARAGEWSPLMAQVVRDLDQDDMLGVRGVSRFTRSVKRQRPIVVRLRLKPGSRPID